jgi:hypothetical protein
MAIQTLGRVHHGGPQSVPATNEEFLTPPLKRLTIHGGWLRLKSQLLLLGT